MDPTGTAGTPEGEELVKKNGAEVVVNHRSEGYEKTLADAFPEGLIVFYS